MIYERIKKILSEQFEIENVDLNTVIHEDLNLNLSLPGQSRGPGPSSQAEGREDDRH